MHYLRLPFAVFKIVVSKAAAMRLFFVEGLDWTYASRNQKFTCSLSETIIITLCPHFIREHNSFTASESYGTFYLTMSFVVKRGEYEDTNDVLQEAPPLLSAPSSSHLASM